MKLSAIKWDYTINLQISYYLHIAHQIQSGYFQSIKAIILPYKDRSGWYFPNYDLFNNSSFTEQLSTWTEDNFFTPTPTLVTMVKSHLTEFPNKENVSIDQQQFAKYDKPFRHFLKNTFPKYQQLDSITFIPTTFGTGSSTFFKKSHAEKFDLFVTYRDDFGITAAMKGIVTAFVSLDFPDATTPQSFMNRLKLSDYLFHSLFIHNKDIKTTFGPIESLLDYTPNALATGVAYYSRMKTPFRTQFSIEGNVILLNSQPLYSLTTQEQTILTLLVHNKNRLVSYDEIGEHWWGNQSQEKFSLSAIAKCIEHIRKKLRTKGLTNQQLKTIRNRGYALFDF